MDIAQLKHELPRQEKLDLERKVSHMYDIPQSRIRCRRSYLWYRGTWSPESSRGFVSCGTPVLGCRSRLGRSLVGSMPCAWFADLLIIVLLIFRRWPRCTTCIQIRPMNLLLKKKRPLPCTLPPPVFTMTHQETLLSKAEA